MKSPSTVVPSPANTQKIASNLTPAIAQKEDKNNFQNGKSEIKPPVVLKSKPQNEKTNS